MPNEMILIRWYFEYNDWAKVAQITKKKKKIRFIREQGRLFQSERAQYADTFPQHWQDISVYTWPKMPFRSVSFILALQLWLKIQDRNIPW